VHIIEADGIAEGADIFDLVAESVSWLKERQGMSATSHLAVTSSSHLNVKDLYWSDRETGVAD